MKMLLKYTSALMEFIHLKSRPYKRLAFMMFFLFGAGNSHSQSQEVYRTIKGDIALSVLYKDTTLIASSNQLIALIDYNTGRLFFKVAYSTFHTGIDSIDNELKTAPAGELKFEGKLDIFINSKNYTPQKYNVTGSMTSGSTPFFAEGNGNVICVPAAAYDDIPSCKLLATLHCKISDLNLTHVFKNAYPTLQIDIQQSLLERDK